MTDEPAAGPPPKRPQNLEAPTIVGVPQVGVPLTAAPGVWYSTTEITFAYRWLKHPVGTAVGFVQIGNNSASYTPQPADMGRAVTVQVTATNAAGWNEAASQPTAAVAAALPVPDGPPPPTKPVDVVAPSITGDPVVGATLTIEDGTWQ